MPDLQKVFETKENILSIIRSKGPSFPARISRETGVSPLFTSAFLSELVSERKLRISNMKVGSSPIYYIEGQEKMLEDFSEYLNSREKEAFFSLKKEIVLNDEELDPALRVALRKIKDFAFPVTVRINDNTKIFWRYFQTSEEEAKELIRKSINQDKKEEIKIPSEKKEEISAPEKQISDQITESLKEKKIEPIWDNSEEKSIEKTEKREIEVEKKEIRKEKQAKQTLPDSIELINEYLKNKDIEVKEEILSKKKEYVAKVKADLKFGEQEFYLMFKDKKKVNQNDLTIAVQQAQTVKMPAIILSTGDLDKKASEYLAEWKNMIKFEKLNP